MTTSVDPIEKLRALLSEATPGPWEVRAVDGLAAVAGRGGWVMEGDAAPAETDAELIAALRNLAPELLAVVEAVERMRRRYAYARDGEATVDGLRALWDASDALRAKAAEVPR